MNGFELALQRQNENRSATYIALTGYAQAEDRQRSRAAGFSRHLVKPLSVTSLLEALADVSTEHEVAS